MTYNTVQFHININTVYLHTYTSPEKHTQYIFTSAADIMAKLIVKTKCSTDNKLSHKEQNAAGGGAVMGK